MIKEFKQINWKSVFIIIGVMALGMLLVNQTFSWYYKIEFLKTPCDLCSELNPHLQDCFKDKSRYQINPLTNEVMSGSPELIKELNRRENKDYGYFNWSLEQ